MSYETKPIKVEASQQMFVSASILVPPNGIQTVNVGDWIVKWPDGRLEMFPDAMFREKFRHEPIPQAVFMRSDGPRIIQ